MQLNDTRFETPHLEHSTHETNSPINFQVVKSLLAWIGIPGKILKLEEAQKKVLSSSGT
jgi:hypothetical protein